MFLPIKKDLLSPEYLVPKMPVALCPWRPDDHSRPTVQTLFLFLFSLINQPVFKKSFDPLKGKTLII